jgi:gamma-glutamylcyclotransferase (GGCT)/AIG2-like uncharacterized protein YtfP
MGKAPSHLFVYGTLMRGGRSPYAKLLQTRARFVGEAFSPGLLYRLGRYPGAIFDEDSPARIFGEVFRLNGPALLDSLDVYEGCSKQDTKPHLFRRDTIQVQLVRGRLLMAWAYSFAANVAGRRLIASGRFRVI